MIEPLDSQPLIEPVSASLPAGQLLREAREALGLTPEQVAGQLKLSVRQIIAIEQEAFNELPSNLFVRGFVRNYARLVKLDAEPLLDYLAQTLPQERSQSALPEVNVSDVLLVAPPSGSQTNTTWLLPSMVVLGLLLGAGLVFWYLQQPTGPELALPDLQAPPILELGATVPEVASTVAIASAASSMSGQNLASGVASAVTAIAASKPVTQDASAALMLTTTSVRVTSETDSWVQIVDANGNKLLSEIIRPGFERIVDGKPPYAVKVGNAPKTTLFFHGQNVDLSRHLKPGSDVVNLELK